MALVSYSESEGSDDEKPQSPTTINTQPSTTKPTTKSDTKFTVDKSNPRKIRVNLQEIEANAPAHGGSDEEPARKRPKIRAAISDFNSMLPAPKRDTQSASGAKAAVVGVSRKVFSLKTGAEPGFSRDSDEKLRQQLGERGNDLVAGGLAVKLGEEQDTAGTMRQSALPSDNPPSLPKQGNAMLFKPLSVARNAQKKKPQAKMSAVAPASQLQLDKAASTPSASSAVPKVNLFSIGNADVPLEEPNTHKAVYEPMVDQGTEGSEEIDPILAIAADGTAGSYDPISQILTDNSSQSLDSIAADLNLSASAKRQLLGRNHKNAAKISSSIINFNTDQEYTANEVLRASGEQIQHNPVRAIAPGKHSLKQLVSAASGQKEALEESFASGRRNKKEAGGRYGW